MIKETKGYRVLQGMRGEKPKDITSLVELLVQVSQLAARYPQIREIDLNPIRVYENGYSILDARILLDEKYPGCNLTGICRRIIPSPSRSSFGSSQGKSAKRDSNNSSMTRPLSLVLGCTKDHPRNRT
jgi:hypothetical protein